MGRYLRPTSLPAALAALADGRLTVLAGGTDHFPTRVVTSPEEDILDISALPDLRTIRVEAASVWLPCLATWSDVIGTKLPPLFDGLTAAARQIGGRQVQNVATVLGNVCNASPAADGRRTLPLAEFVRGPRQTARRPDELALGLRIPLPAAPARTSFDKLGARRYLVISIVMVAAVAEFSADGRIARARIAVGACSPVARRLPALEAALAGQFADPDLVQAEHMAPLTPIDDVRASAAYRSTAALELVRRAVAGLAAPRAVAA